MLKLSSVLAYLLVLIMITVFTAGCAASTTSDPTKTTTSSTSAATTAATTSSTTAATTSSTTAATTSPTTAATTSAAASQAKAFPFRIQVVPEQLNGNAIVGQKCVFLVTIADEGQKSNVAVTITAEAANADIFIDHKEFMEGQVAEITVTPQSSSKGKTIDVTFTGKRQALSDQKTISFEVIEGKDDRKEYATELRKKFVSWLEKNHPELGIKSDTKWTGTMVSPQWLVVSHYLFFSDKWEMHVEWHIMIAPHDWAKIDLRKRFEEAKPSYAFEISSLSAKSTPKPIEVPTVVWR